MLKLEIKSSGLDGGIQHGEAFRREIRELAAIRMQLTRSYFQKSDDLKNICDKQIIKLKKIAPLAAEFSGIAIGAHITEHELLVLNNYTDLRDFSSVESNDDKGCSVFALMNKNSSICGQTWDMHASARPYMLHLTVHKPVHQEILTLAGCLALTGVNEHGVALLINNLHCSSTGDGLAWPALVRLALTQQTAQQTVSLIRNNLPASGHNYLVCDSNEALNVETTGEALEISGSARNPGYVFHTNHYIGSLAASEITSRVSATTRKRYQELSTYFSKLDIESATVASLSQDILGGLKTPMVNIKPPATPSETRTCGGFMADLKTRNGFMFAGNFSDGDQVKFTF